LPAFVGDLLISRQLAAPVDLPTLAEPRIAPGLDNHFASSLSQKLVIVRSYFLLAWAGSKANADRIIRGLDQVLPERSGELHDGRIVLDLLNSCEEDSELLAVVIHGGKVQPVGARTCGFELNGKRIYLLGSGRTDFLDYLEEHPALLHGQEGADGLLARAIVLRFGARAMTLQSVLGTGLEQSWGGGFEVAYPEPNGFRKCDKLLFRAWKIEADGSYANSGRSFFTRYYGRDLHLSRFNPEEKTFVVGSPLGTPVTPPRYERCAPSCTVDFFLHGPSGSFVEAARFHPDNRPVKDFVEMVDGQLAGWAMDREYVDGLVHEAVAQVERGTSFVFRRY
jgi:hypothetical protein